MVCGTFPTHSSARQEGGSTLHCPRREEYDLLVQKSVSMVETLLSSNEIQLLLPTLQ